MTLPDGDAWLTPAWHPHPRVRARVTTRAGTFSPPPWHGFNLGANCDDAPERVATARAHVWQVLGTREAPRWLSQVHGVEVVDAARATTGVEADGSWTTHAGLPCAVLTADCLPVLLARADGAAVAAVHAGWRGLVDGIVERGVRAIAPAGEPVSAWIGPAICQRCYQVDDGLRTRFLAADAAAAAAFVADGPGHWRFDLAHVARQRLQRAGVDDVIASGLCTACESERFYSFRRDGRTGRFASLVWLAD